MKEVLKGFKQYIGCKLVGVKMTEVLEGGLTFVFEKERKKHKVVLGYTELGAWIYDPAEVKEQKKRIKNEI